MGFSTIIAFLSFGIALVALWLVSDVLKKVETQNDKFVRAHIAALREEIRDTNRDVEKVARGLESLASTLDGADKRINDHTTEIAAARAVITKVAGDLDLLDRSIPQRFRARVVPPKESEAGGAVKGKPTVQ